MTLEVLIYNGQALESEKHFSHVVQECACGAALGRGGSFSLSVWCTAVSASRHLASISIPAGAVSASRILPGATAASRILSRAAAPSSHTGMATDWYRQVDVLRPSTFMDELIQCNSLLFSSHLRKFEYNVF